MHLWYRTRTPDTRARGIDVTVFPWRPTLAALALLVALALPARAAQTLTLFDFEGPYLLDPGHSMKDHGLFFSNGQWHLFYIRGEEFGSTITEDELGHAVSADLRNWTVLPPALVAGPEPWDERNVWAPEIIDDPNNPGQRLMLYTGADDLVVQRMGIASTSDPDLMSWVKSIDNPVLQPDSLVFEWAPDESFSSFRDPFYFFHDGVHQLLHTARIPDQTLGAGKRGVVHRFTSVDFNTWVEHPPFIQHNAPFAAWHEIESVQLHHEAGFWHLFFSETAEEGTWHTRNALFDTGWDIDGATQFDRGLAPEVTPISPGEYLFTRHDVVTKLSDGTQFAAIRVDSLTFNSQTGLPEKVTLDPLASWPVRTGTAFEAQPTFGDNSLERGDLPTLPVGHGYISSREQYMGPASAFDSLGAEVGVVATGTMQSADLNLQGSHVRLLVGGSDDPDAFVALVDASSDQVLHSASGFDTPTMHVVHWPLSQLPNGGKAYLWIEDSSTTGYVNVDDIRFLDLVDAAFSDGSKGPLADATTSTGVAWGDYDGDGDDDLYVARFNGANRLLRNDGSGDFVDVTTAPLDDASASQGVAWADYDNDGDLDLYVGNSGQPNKLLRQEPTGSFTDVTPALLADSGGSQSVNWVDTNLDGNVDLFLALDDGGNKLFLGDGAGGFVDGTPPAFAATTDATNGAAWADYDNDGDADLYVANGGANALFRNDGASGFADVTTGALGNSGSGIGTAWADYDNDGDFDLYYVNVGTANGLLRNDGAQGFVDVTSSPIDDPTGQAQGVAWGDYDNDGDADLYVTNFGPNRLFRNDGGDAFADVTEEPLDDAGTGQGAAWADANGDGSVDLYVANAGQANRLLLNAMGFGNNWLRLRLVGTASNWSAIGARITVTAGGLTQTAAINGGSGYLSQNSAAASFGLGQATQVDDIVIEWPSGITQVLTNFDVNQTVTVVEAAPVAVTDLVLSKTVSDSLPESGQTVTFTISVTNDGPDGATGVRVQDAPSSELVFVSATPTQGSFDPGSGIWDVGNLADGASADLLVDAIVQPTTTTIANVAQVLAVDQADPNTWNNSAIAMVYFPQVITLDVAKDSWLREQSPGTNFGSDTELECETVEERNRRSVIQFDLSPLPSQVLVLDATLGLFVTSRDATGDPVLVFRVTDPWQENSVNWNNFFDAFDPSQVHGGFTPLFAFQTVRANITSLARGWLNQSYPNHGMMLISTSDDDLSRYASRESFADWRPFLSVAFVDNGSAPLAVNDGVPTPVQTDMNTPVAIEVLTNDSDPDGLLNPATVAINIAAVGSSTSVDPATGTVTYTPAPGFTGTDSFSYTVRDNLGNLSNVATVFIEVSDPATSAPALPNLTRARLLPNVPNPFNPVTTLRMEMPVAGVAQLSIYDERGRRTMQFDKESLSTGMHQRRWRGQDHRGRPVASGVYFVVLRVNDTIVDRQPITLVR